MQYISWCDEDFFISGGEDCTLRINRVCRFKFEQNSFKNIGIFNGHLSGIKCISVIQLYKSGFQYLIFSGGGRAQLKIWGINVKVLANQDYRERDYQEKEINVSDVNSYMLYEQNQYCRKPWQETKQSYIAEPETRYTDIYAYYSSFEVNHVLVFIACADGYLR